jgi:hypothetical protein
MHRPVAVAAVEDTAAGEAEVLAEVMGEASVVVTSVPWVGVLVEAVSAARVEGSARAEAT